MSNGWRFTTNSLPNSPRTAITIASGGIDVSSLPDNTPIVDGETYAPVDSVATLIGMDAVGQWQLTVRDSSLGDPLCHSGAALTVSTSLEVDLVGTNSPCGGQPQGSVEVNPRGGSGRYRIVSATQAGQNPAYSTSPSAQFVITQVAANIPLQVEVIEVTNGGIEAFGATGSAVIVIGEETTLVADCTASPSDLTCYGGNDSELVVGASGGTGQFCVASTVPPTRTYSPSTNCVQTATGLSRLPSATPNYEITIVDENGCQASCFFDSSTINGPTDPISVSILDNQGVSCNGFTDGSTAFQVSGGNPGIYSMDGSVSVGCPANYATDYADNDEVYTCGLSAGSQNAIFRDSRNCPFPFSWTVSNVDPFSLRNEVNNANVGCTVSGSRSFEVAGGPAGGITVSGQNTQDLSAVTFSGSGRAYSFDTDPNGVYTVTITSVNTPACQETLGLGSFPAPIVTGPTVGGTLFTCVKQSDGRDDRGATVNFSNLGLTFGGSSTGLPGTPDWSITSHTPDVACPSSTPTDCSTLIDTTALTVSNLWAAEWSITATDAASGCSATVDVTVQPHPDIEATQREGNCEAPNRNPPPYARIFFTITSGDPRSGGRYTIERVSGNSFSVSGARANPFATSISPGTGTPTVAITGEYCREEFTLNFQYPTPMTATLSTTPVFDCYGDPIDLVFILGGGSGSVTIESFNAPPAPQGFDPDEIDGANTITLHNRDTPFTLTVRTVDSEGCRQDFTFNIPTIAPLDLSFSGNVCAGAESDIILTPSGGRNEVGDYYDLQLISSPSSSSAGVVYEGGQWILRTNATGDYGVQVDRLDSSDSVICSDTFFTTINPITVIFNGVSPFPTCANGGNSRMTVSLSSFASFTSFQLLQSSIGTIQGSPCTLNDASELCTIIDLAAGQQIDVDFGSSPSGCTVSGRSTTPNVSPLTATPSTLAAATCSAVNDGEIEFTISGGWVSTLGANIINVDDSAALAAGGCANGGLPSCSGSTISNLQGGTDYWITVEDGGGCTRNFGPFSVGTESQSLSTPVDESCFNSGIVSVQATVTDASPPPVLSVLGGGGSVEGTYPNYRVTGLAFGTTHTLVLRDAGQAACQAQVSASLGPAPPEPQIVSASDSLSCQGTSVQTVTCTSATACFVEDVNSGPSGGLVIGTVSNGNTLLTATVAGTYELVIENNLGCQSTQDYVITDVEDINASISLTQAASCNGVADGAAAVTVISPAGTYIIEELETTCSGNTNGVTCPSGREVYPSAGSFDTPQSITSLIGGGDYSFRVARQSDTDCFTTVSISIPPANPVFANSIDYSCSDEGRIVVDSISGGSSSSYSIAPSSITCSTPCTSPIPTVQTFGSGFIIEGLPLDADIDFSINDGSCDYQFSARTQTPIAVRVDSSNIINPPSCYSTPDAEVEFTSISGGDEGVNGPYTVVNVGGIIPLPVGSTSTLTFTGIGNDRPYDVTIQDGRGCLWVVPYQVNAGPAAPIIGIASVNPPSCPDTTDGSVTLNPQGTDPFTIRGVVLETPDPSLAEPTIAGLTINGLAARSYVVTLEDGNNCFHDEVIFPGGAFSLNGEEKDPIRCFGNEEGRFQISVVQGQNSGPFTTSLVPLNAPPGPEVVLDLGSGTFDVDNVRGGVIFLFTVTNSGRCEAELQFSMSDPPRLNYTVTMIEAITCEGFSDGEIDIEVEGGTATIPGVPNTFTIDVVPNDNGVVISPYMDTATFKGFHLTSLSEENYQVTVKDAYLCERTRTLIVTEPKYV